MEKRNASTEVTVFCHMKSWVFFVYFESMQLLALLFFFFNLLSGVQCSSCGLTTGCDPYQTQEEMGTTVGT